MMLLHHLIEKLLIAVHMVICTETHMLLFGVRALKDQLRRRMPMDGKMHLVLHGLKEKAGRLRIFIIIKGRCVDQRPLRRGP